MKSLNELFPGDSLVDLHGRRPQKTTDPESLGLKDCVITDLVEVGYGMNSLDGEAYGKLGLLIQDAVGHGYMNKYLVCVDRGGDWAVLAYAYDGNRGAFIRVERKDDGDNS